LASLPFGYRNPEIPGEHMCRYGRGRERLSWLLAIRAAKF